MSGARCHRLLLAL
uniref:Uncharacterized protein n=1 Tax=Arundo donax TaxID=35708 RepID=A0A0A9A5Y8_ARUDO